jgi:hypothetical protein
MGSIGAWQLRQSALLDSTPVLQAKAKHMVTIPRTNFSRL